MNIIFIVYSILFSIFILFRIIDSHILSILDISDYKVFKNISKNRNNIEACYSINGNKYFLLFIPSNNKLYKIIHWKESTAYKTSISIEDVFTNKMILLGKYDYKNQFFYKKIYKNINTTLIKMSDNLAFSEDVMSKISQYDESLNLLERYKKIIIRNTKIKDYI